MNTERYGNNGISAITDFTRRNLTGHRVKIMPGGRNIILGNRGNAEDTAMSMFTPEEQRQLIDLSRTFTKNLTKLVNQEMEE